MLDLHNNQFTELPKEIAVLKQLTALNLSGCCQQYGWRSAQLSDSCWVMEQYGGFYFETSN